MHQGIPQTTPDDLRQRLADGEELLIVDVREPAERQAYALESSIHIPLMQIPQRIDELPTDRPVVFVCSAGARSMNAALFAAPYGVRAENLAGGLSAWVQSQRHDA